MSPTSLAVVPSVFSLCCWRAEETRSDSGDEGDVVEMGAVEDEEAKGIPRPLETTPGIARVLPQVDLVAGTSEYPVCDGTVWL